MSLIVPTNLQQAFDTIHLFAEIPETPPLVITANLGVINQWGLLRKIFLRCFIDKYLGQLNPLQSTEAFKTRLATVMSSNAYSKAPGLHLTCARACAIFNRLIVKTNMEVHPSKRTPGKDLFVNFKEAGKKRIADLSCNCPPSLPKPEKDTVEKPFIQVPGEEIAKEEYDNLLGKMTPQETMNPLVKEKGSDSSPSEEAVSGPIVPATSASSQHIQEQILPPPVETITPTVLDSIFAMPAAEQSPEPTVPLKPDQDSPEIPPARDLEIIMDSPRKKQAQATPFHMTLRGRKSTHTR